MNKFYTLLAAMLVVLTAGAQNILPQGKEFAGVGDQVTSFDAIESDSLYVLRNITGGEGYNYENGNLIYKTGNNAPTASAVVKITKVDGQANTATIQAYSGAYYQTLVVNQQVQVGENAVNYTFEQTGNNFFIKTGNLTINSRGSQPAGRDRSSFGGGYSQYSIWKANLQDATEHTYNLEVYGFPKGSNPTFTLNGNDFKPGTPLTIKGQFNASDLKLTSEVPENYELNPQNSIAYVASTNTFKVTLLCKQPQSFDDLGLAVSFDKNNFATTIDPTKWYIITNKRGDNSSDLQGQLRYMLYRATSERLGSEKFWMTSDDQFQTGTELTEANSVYLFRFVETDSSDVYYVQCANARYFGNLSRSTILSGNEPEQGGFPFVIKQIGDNEGFFYVQNPNNLEVLDNNAVNETTNDGIKYGTVVGWNSTPATVPTTTTGNNVWQFIPVEFSNEMNTVTYIFRDSKTGDSIYAYKQRAIGGTTVRYSGPASSSLATFTTPEDITNLDGDVTVNITVTQNLPFIPSTSYDNATWYYWKNASQSNAHPYLYYSSSANNIPMTAKCDSTDAYKWAFIGSAFQGFKIVNKAAGATKFVNSANVEDGTDAYMGDTEKYWSLYLGQPNDGVHKVPSNLAGYLFTFNEGNHYMNDYGGQGCLQFFQNGPAQDAGSNWTAELAGFTTYYADLHLNNDSTYGTTYLPVAVTVGEGVKAYTLNKVSDGTATLTEVKGTIPANTGVILIGAANVTNAKLTASTAEAAPVEGNLLQGLATPTTAGSTNYYLSELNGKIGLYTRSGDAANTVSVNKAYLPASAVATGAKGFTFSFDNTTGISSVNADKATSADAPRYNLAGQRVGKSYKGVVIVGGKKVLVK